MEPRQDALSAPTHQASRWDRARKVLASVLLALILAVGVAAFVRYDRNSRETVERRRDELPGIAASLPLNGPTPEQLEIVDGNCEAMQPIRIEREERSLLPTADHVMDLKERLEANGWSAGDGQDPVIAGGNGLMLLLEKGDWAVRAQVVEGLDGSYATVAVQPNEGLYGCA